MKKKNVYLQLLMQSLLDLHLQLQSFSYLHSAVKIIEMSCYIYYKHIALDMGKIYTTIEETTSMNELYMKRSEKKKRVSHR